MLQVESPEKTAATFPGDMSAELQLRLPLRNLCQHRHQMRCNLGTESTGSNRWSTAKMAGIPPTCCLKKSAVSVVDCKAWRTVFRSLGEGCLFWMRQHSMTTYLYYSILTKLSSPKTSLYKFYNLQDQSDKLIGRQNPPPLTSSGSHFESGFDDSWNMTLVTFAQAA